MKKTNNANKNTKNRVAKTEAPVLDAVNGEENVNLSVAETPAVVSNSRTCSTCSVTEENGVNVLFGKAKNTCRKCGVAKANAWTTARAEYRKAYQLGVKYQNAGIMAVLPNAKDWKEGDPILTYEYTDIDTGAVIPAGSNADEIYAAKIQANRDARTAAKAERELIASQARETRRAEREARRAERETLSASQALEAKVARDEAKRVKAEQRQAKAAEALVSRNEARKLKATERAEKAQVNAQAKLQERVANQKARAEARAAKAAEKHVAAQVAKGDAIDSHNNRAVEALAKAMTAVNG